MNKLLNEFETERLILKQDNKSYINSITYYIYLKRNNEKIGEINIIKNGEIFCMIYQYASMDHGYEEEAKKLLLSKFKNV